MRSNTAFFLVGGLALLAFGAWLDREGRRAAAWPTTEGVLLVLRAEDVSRRS